MPSVASIHYVPLNASGRNWRLLILLSATHITGSRGDEGTVFRSLRPVPGAARRTAAQRSRRRRSRRAGMLKRLRGLRRVRPRAIPHVIRALPSLAFSFLGEDKLISLLCPCPTGFYVDVGAFHPIVGSNTYKLYLRGWHGITIEPCHDNARLFEQMRPWDRHLTIGIAAESSTLTYHRFAHAGLNTFDPKTAQAVARTDAVTKVATETVICQPLSEVLDQYAPGQHVDLLSVDAEGFDLAVLQSLDWQRRRPTAICVEDIAAYNLGTLGKSQFSAIRAFLHTRDYWLVSQALVSFVYVDRHAIGQTEPARGFRINASQVEWLARLAAWMLMPLVDFTSLLFWSFEN